MNLIHRVADVAASVVPLEQGRQLLLLPVRILRSGAVTVARTSRHWELALEGTTEPAIDLRGSTSPGTEHAVRHSADPAPTSDAAAPQTRSDQDDRRSSEELTSDDLAVDDWAELSLADARARLAGLADTELVTLLDYERAHGHRLQYTLLLENRLGQSTSPTT